MCIHASEGELQGWHLHYADVINVAWLETSEQLETLDSDTAFEVVTDNI